MQQHYPAARIRRIAAAFIDCIPFLPLYFADRWMETQTNQHLLFAYFTISWQLGWLYFAYLHYRFGQTLGKWRHRIRLVSFSDGQKVTWRQALIRESPYILMIAICTVVWIASNIAWYLDVFTERWDQWSQLVFSWSGYAGIIWGLIELLSMAFHPLRRSLPDLMAGTIVIRVQPPGEHISTSVATEPT